jgi:hypothetical protein
LCKRFVCTMSCVPILTLLEAFRSVDTSNSSPCIAAGLLRAAKLAHQSKGCIGKELADARIVEATTYPGSILVWVNSLMIYDHILPAKTSGPLQDSCKMSDCDCQSSDITASIAFFCQYLTRRQHARRIEMLLCVARAHTETIQSQSELLGNSVPTYAAE